MLYVRYVRLTKNQAHHKRQTHLLVREDVTQGLLPQEFMLENKSLVVSLKGSGAVNRSRKATYTLTNVPLSVQN
jgi:hypothetical protein